MKTVKKTGQLKIPATVAGKNIISKEKGTVYFYYTEILSNVSCSFDINGEIIECSPNKPLIIRTPISSLICLKGGVSLNIIYETGDSTSFSCSGLKETIGNGSLKTDSQTIIGAINEIYSTPTGGGGGGSGVRYPNEKVLLKISQESLDNWDYAYANSQQNQSVIDEINSKIVEINKVNSIQDNFFYQVEGAINSISSEVSQKANSTSLANVEKEIALKVSYEYFNEEINKKASIDDISTLATKEQVNTIEENLDKKLNTVDGENLYKLVQTKADKRALDEKANKEQIEILYSIKADKDELERGLTELKGKASKEELDVSNSKISENATSIKNIKTAFEENKNYTENNINRLYGETVSNKNNIDTIETRVKNLENNSSVTPPTNPEEGFRFPNEVTLLKISESSLSKWDGYGLDIANNSKILEDNGEQISLIKSLAEDNLSKITKNSASIEESNILVSNLSEDFEKYSEYLQGVGSSITTIESKLQTKVSASELASEVLRLEGSISDVSSNSATKEELESLKSSKADVSKLAAIETSLSKKANNSDLQQLKTNLSKKADITTVSNISSVVNANKLSIEKNSEKISELYIKEASNAVNIENLDAKVTLLEGVVSKPPADNAEEVTKLTEAFNKVGDAIRENVADISELKINVKDAVQDIELVATEVESVNESVINLTTANNSNTIYMQKLASRVGVLEEDLESLSSEIKTSEFSFDKIYEVVSTPSKTIGLKIDKMISVEFASNSYSSYVVNIPSGIEKPTQFGFSIATPVDKPIQISFSSFSTIYWTEKIESLDSNSVYEFIFTFHSKVLTGGFTKYVT